jgi:hypothetical protein
MAGPTEMDSISMISSCYKDRLLTNSYHYHTEAHIYKLEVLILLLWFCRMLDIVHTNVNEVKPFNFYPCFMK